MDLVLIMQHIIEAKTVELFHILFFLKIDLKVNLAMSVSPSVKRSKSKIYDRDIFVL